LSIPKNQKGVIILSNNPKGTNLEQEQVLEARRAYQREWRKNNRDKVKRIQERFYSKKAAELASVRGGE